MVQHPQRRRRVGIRHNQRGGAVDTGGDQRLAAAGIAIDHGVASPGGLAHAVRVEVQRHVVDALALEHMRQVLPAPAKSADDRVLLGLQALGGDAGHVERLHQPFVGGKAQHDGVAVLDQERRRQHRQQHRGQDDLDQHRIHQPDPVDLVQQHEAELARLRQPQTGTDGHTLPRAEQPRQHRDQHQLEQDRHEQQPQHQPDVRNHHADVQQHADGDEEQPQQHVAERLDVLLHLVPVGRFRDQHARQERAERHRQAQPLGQRGHAERDQQQVQHEQFLRAPRRHHVEPAAHQPLPDEEDQAEGHHDLDRGQAQGRRQLPGVARERRDDDQQRHHGQILEQQHADDVAAVLGLQLHALGKHLGDDGRRGHGQRPAQRHRGLPGQASPGRERPAGRHHEPHRQHHLGAAQPEHEPFHRAELAQVELEPDREHQEDHAEFGQVLGLGGIAGQRERVGTDQDANRQVAQHGWQLQHAESHHAENGGGQQHEGQFQRRMHSAGLGKTWAESGTSRPGTRAVPASVPSRGNTASGGRRDPVAKKAGPVAIAFVGILRRHDSQFRCGTST
ncbi:hypothetical protein D3C87_1199830 [compost metagenome]